MVGVFCPLDGLLVGVRVGAMVGLRVRKTVGALEVGEDEGLGLGPADGAIKREISPTPSNTQ